MIDLAGAYNVRDLGGLRTRDGRSVRPGLVYRGDALTNLTDADRDLLFGELDISIVVDLRTAEEAGGDGMADARALPGVRAYHHSLMPEGRIGREPFPSGDPERLARRYFDNLEEGAVAAAAAFRLMCDAAVARTPLLFHCAAGRDRTGVVAAVLLDLLGVHEEDIVRDYELSNTHARQVTRELRQNPLYANGAHHAGPGSGREVELLDGRTIRGFLTLLAAEYGGGRRWAEFHGVDAAELSHHLLDGRPSSLSEARPEGSSAD